MKKCHVTRLMWQILSIRGKSETYSCAIYLPLALELQLWKALKVLPKSAASYAMAYNLKIIEFFVCVCEWKTSGHKN